MALGLLASLYAIGMEWFIGWYSGAEFEAEAAYWVVMPIEVLSLSIGALLLLFPRRSAGPGAIRVRAAVAIVIALGLLVDACGRVAPWMLPWYSGVDREGQDAVSVWIVVGLGSSSAGALLLLMPRRFPLVAPASP